MRAVLPSVSPPLILFPQRYLAKSRPVHYEAPPTVYPSLSGPRIPIYTLFSNTFQLPISRQVVKLNDNRKSALHYASEYDDFKTCNCVM